MSNFSFSYDVFYSFGEPSAIFIKFKIVVCQCFEIGKVKSVVLERVKLIFPIPALSRYLKIKYEITSLTNNKILDVIKLKALADDKINVAQTMISVFDRVENIVLKGEIAGYQHFLLFQKCFQKASFFGG